MPNRTAPQPHRRCNARLPSGAGPPPLAAFGCALLATATPAFAADVTDDHGLVFAPMVETDRICDFLLSPGLSKLADLRAADYDASKPIFEELSNNVHNWLQMRMKALNQENTASVFPSPETKVELGTSFAQCVKANATIPAVEKVLTVFFPGYLQSMKVDLTRPYFGGGLVALDTMVFTASMIDGAAALDAFLQWTGNQSAIALAKIPASGPSKAEAAPTPEQEADAVFGQMTTDQNNYAQYTCSLSGNLILGLPVIVGQERFMTVQLSVDTAGTVNVNGVAIKPQNVKRSDSSGEISAAYYNALDVFKALTPTYSDPGVTNPTQERLQSFKQLQEYQREQIDTILGDRRRYMLLNLELSSVSFFDLTPDNRSAAVMSPTCY